MHQWSSNKKCYTIIESTELRRTHTANRSTILFNLRGTLAFSHVERVCLMPTSTKTLFLALFSLKLDLKLGKKI